MEELKGWEASPCLFSKHPPDPVFPAAVDEVSAGGGGGGGGVPPFFPFFFIFFFIPLSFFF